MPQSCTQVSTFFSGNQHSKRITFSVDDEIPPIMYGIYLFVNNFILFI